MKDVNFKKGDKVIHTDTGEIYTVARPDGLFLYVEGVYGIFIQDKFKLITREKEPK